MKNEVRLSLHIISRQRNRDHIYKIKLKDYNCSYEMFIFLV